MESHSRALQAAGIFGAVIVGWLGLSVVPRLEDALKAAGGPQSCPAAVDRQAAMIEALAAEVKRLRVAIEKMP